LALFAAPAQAVAQERVKFPVGVGTKTLGTGLIWLATKKGFFEEFALDVQPILLRGTTVAVQALEILVEESRTAPQDAAKYIDRSCLQQALKEF